MSIKRCKYCGEHYKYDVMSDGYSEDHCTVTCDYNDKITKLENENERLKKELADSLPLQKIREMVNNELKHCLSVYSEVNPFSVCVRIGIKDFSGEILSKIEQYVKEVRGEL